MNILRIIYDFADENVQTEGLSPGPYDLTIAQGKIQGNQIYVLTGNLNGKNLKQGKLSYKLANNITVYNLPRAIWRFGPFLSTSLFVLPYYSYLKIFKKIDIVHNHQQMGVWFLLYKYLFGFIDKTPVVHTNHGSIKGREETSLEQGQTLDFWTKYFEYPIWKFNDLLSTKVAKVLIAVSTGLVDEMKRFYNPRVPIVVVENSVSLDRFAKEGEKVDLGFSSDDKIIFNIGRLSKRKNIDVLVESLHYLPTQFKLSLVGIWDEDFRDEIVNPLIKKYNLESRIKYLGKVSNFIAHKYYRSAEFFVLPSSHEGLPKVVIEALTCGNKVVASGFELTVDVPNLLYLEKIDAKELADAILKIDAQPDRYAETKKIIEKYYSWDSKAYDLEEIYEKVLKQK
ncbi:hypothetical protein CO058_02660 [candidate division WWE3 bacterium CG_4_9_14_0_2_um_filter_35_11]|uniref:Glycosyl transferase family 1 domain-containing protein n=1 Tax=candidate division WWE3 bacterium CG_4_9_14_0_2_um_filter_35_11 TaxID=1975077 RepID=A0A2M8ELL5_UNCKA|nr:MAG: hypothetical protein COV25_02920 [candidate division WWE3 bacterium CG10_big_fil_rev_8_21_14_0_10_35_32]PJC23636.1 MAG: hypothetical protein CO058_02660 [candidate division WWE3 bacterium CG_4_9_14_0_2_um_filter_35_11]